MWTTSQITLRIVVDRYYFHFLFYRRWFWKIRVKDTMRLRRAILLLTLLLSIPLLVLSLQAEEGATVYVPILMNDGTSAGSPTSTPIIITVIVTVVVTATPTPMPTFTNTSTASPTPTRTPTSTITPTPTSSPTPSPTPTSDFCGTLQGAISTDIALTSSCSYLVTGNVHLTSGTTMTVEAGVKIKFDGLFYILLDGSVFTLGTLDNPVRITSNNANPKPGDWGSLVFQGEDTISSLSHTIIEYGGGHIGGSKWAEITVNKGATSLRVTNTTLRESDRNAIYSIGTLTVTNSYFEKNAGGIEVTGGDLTVMTSTFTLTQSPIIHGWSGTKTKITDSVFQNNSVDATMIYIRGTASRFERNLINGNQQLSGSRLIRADNGVVRHNTICRNSQYNESLVALSGQVDFHDNNIEIPEQGYSVILFGSNSEPEFDGSENYWFTDDLLIISRSVYDYYDDPVRRRFSYEPISYSPISTAPNINSCH